jgi:hypothetical protein
MVVTCVMARPDSTRHAYNLIEHLRTMFNGNLYPLSWSFDRRPPLLLPARSAMRARLFQPGPFSFWDADNVVL